MGKKAKIGKARRDKFYKLAKETGYRARSAFKLLQLNRRYEFFHKARVCIDLCAAPGSWMQVAAQNMPISSVIVGVDLFPIPAITGTNSIIGDITDEKTRGLIERYTQTWKADVVLNDGAPNIGKNWLHDAFAQSSLTLAALKLAAYFLRKGGTFVTKLFRSRDYHSMMWVLKQLFNKVHSTKPKASRLESTEIFIVCKGFLKPDKIDPKFFDPKHVFKEIDVPVSQYGIEKQLNANLKKVRAQGYEEGATKLEVSLNVSDFFAGTNSVELLTGCHKIIFDDEEIENNVLTTDAIKASCADIKVLSFKDLRKLLNWRKRYLQHKEDDEAAAEEEQKKLQEASDGSSEEDTDEEAEAAKIDAHVAKLQEAESKELKRQRKRTLKLKRKARDKMNLKMTIKGDRIADEDLHVFNLKSLKSKSAMKNFKEGNVKLLPSETDGDKTIIQPTIVPPPTYDPNFPEEFEEYHSEEEHGGPDDEITSDSDLAYDSDYKSDDELSDIDKDSIPEAEPEDNPLLVDLDDNKVAHESEMWFDRDGFENVDKENDEDIELAQMAVDYMKKGGKIANSSLETEEKKLQAASTMSEAKAKQAEKRKARKEHVKEKRLKRKKEFERLEKMYDSDNSGRENDDDSDFEMSDIEDQLSYHMSEQDINTPADPNSKRSRKKAKRAAEAAAKEDEVKKPAKVQRLTPEELALAEKLIYSGKSRREIIENAMHKRTYGTGDDIPTWFGEDEKRHNTRPAPVTFEQAQFYRDQQKEIDARPMKKVAEAKARKRMRMVKTLLRARKKSAALEGEETTEQEKWTSIKQIYKKAGLLGKKKKDITYVVAKKGRVGARARRPNGLKGPYRMVDSRMKSDTRVKAKKSGNPKQKGKKKWGPKKKTG